MVGRHVPLAYHFHEPAQAGQVQTSASCLLRLRNNVIGLRPTRRFTVAEFIDFLQCVFTASLGRS